MDRDQVVALIPRLRRYARALVGDPGAADDLVQDTLERALGKFHLWKPGTDLRAWLFAIMHNVHVNQVRRRREVAALDQEAEELPVRAAQEGALAARDLQRGLERLPVEQRQVLLLVVLEDMSYQEVAAALEVPIGTVMSRLSRARDKLRVAMEGSSPSTRLQVVK
ncbi:MAG: RNA polymerase subunit sigma-24 [Betaproteobacteria bacterium SG8_39]|jgi:RNA polymerase sigma-70 factor (ECF subfamily)|nr:MAG: RNA polymerase subunit sigma-24 [Betaproteobacteria bacterium SG8_39]